MPELPRSVYTLLRGVATAGGLPSARPARVTTCGLRRGSFGDDVVHGMVAVRAHSSPEPVYL